MAKKQKREAKESRQSQAALDFGKKVANVGKKQRTVSPETVEVNKALEKQTREEMIKKEKEKLLAMQKSLDAYKK